MAKYLLIAAVVISLATAGLGFVNHGKLVDAVADRDQKATQLASAQKNLKTAQDAEKKATEAAKVADASKEELSTALAAAKAAADKTAGELTAANTAITAKDAEIAALKSQIAAGPNGIPNPTPGGEDPRIAQLTQEKDELVAALEASKTQLAAVQAKLAQLLAENETRQKGMMKKGLEGRILAVNPAWNFVVLSIGDKQGASNNAEMLIKRSGQYLGKVRITSVEPSTSIADIVANTLPDGVSVQPGDSVIFQGQE